MKDSVRETASQLLQ